MTASGSYIAGIVLIVVATAVFIGVIIAAISIYMKKRGG